MGVLQAVVVLCGHRRSIDVDGAACPAKGAVEGLVDACSATHSDASCGSRRPGRRGEDFGRSRIVDACSSARRAPGRRISGTVRLPKTCDSAPRHLSGFLQSQANPEARIINQWVRRTGDAWRLAPASAICAVGRRIQPRRRRRDLRHECAFAPRGRRRAIFHFACHAMADFRPANRHLLSQARPPSSRRMTLFRLASIGEVSIAGPLTDLLGDSEYNGAR
jgi:hypothetical protein